MQAIKLFGLLAVLTLFFACGDDDDATSTAVESEIVINGTTFPLGNGFVSNEFFLGLANDEAYFIYLTGPGLTIDDGDFVGDGAFAILIATGEAGGLPDGTYRTNPDLELDLDSDDLPAGFFSMTAVGSLQNDVLDIEQVSTTGTLTVSTRDGERVLEFTNVVQEDGTTYSGGFRGALQNIDFD